MSKIDLSLPSKFMDACVAKDNVKALRLAKLMAKQHNCTLKAELDLLDFKVQLCCCSRDADLLWCSRIGCVCIIKMENKI